MAAAGGDAQGEGFDSLEAKGMEDEAVGGGAADAGEEDAAAEKYKPDGRDGESPAPVTASETDGGGSGKEPPLPGTPMRETEALADSERRRSQKKKARRRKRREERRARESASASEASAGELEGKAESEGAGKAQQRKRRKKRKVKKQRAGETTGGETTDGGDASAVSGAEGAAGKRGKRRKRKKKDKQKSAAGADGVVVEVDGEKGSEGGKKQKGKKPFKNRRIDHRELPRPKVWAPEDVRKKHLEAAGGVAPPEEQQGDPREVYRRKQEEKGEEPAPPPPLSESDSEELAVEEPGKDDEDDDDAQFGVLHAASEWAKAKGFGEDDDTPREEMYNDYEGLYAGEEELPWVAPSLTSALSNRRRVVHGQGRAPVWRSSWKDLSDMGPGVALYFRFLVYLAVVLVLWTLLYIPAFFFTSLGSSLEEQVAFEDETGTAQLSWGNVRVSERWNWYRNKTITVPQLADTPFKEEEMAFAMSAGDFLGSFLFVLLIFWFRNRIHTVVLYTDAHHVRARDYAVLVRGLPKDAHEADVRRHFSDLFQLSDPDWEFRGYCCGLFCSKESRLPQDLEDVGDFDAGEFVIPDEPVDPKKPVADVSNSGNPEYLGSWVSEVSLAYRDGKGLRAYLQRHRMAEKLKTARAQVKKYSVDTPFAGGPNQSKREKALKVIKKLTAKSQELKDKHPTGLNRECAAAYVVFNHEDSYVRCIEDYWNSGNFLVRWLQPKPLRFRRRTPLRVSPAPEPDEVNWGNLDVSYIERRLRRMVTMLALLVLLSGSFAILQTCRLKQKEFESYIPNPEVCDIHLPAALYNNYFNTSNASVAMPPLILVTEDPWEREGFQMCPSDDEVFIYYDLNITRDGFSKSALAEAGIELPKINRTSVFAVSPGIYDWHNVSDTYTGPCNRPCVNPDDWDDYCQPLACQYPEFSELGVDCPGNQTVNALYRCYCMQETFNAIEEDPIFGYITMWFTLGSLCGGYAREWSLSWMLEYIGCVCIVAMNSVIKRSIVSMVWFERHHSTLAERRTIAVKTMWAQFFNTAIFFLLAYNKLPEGASFPLHHLTLFEGIYEGFSLTWYAEVGPLVLITFCLCVVQPYVLILWRFMCAFPYRRKYRAKHEVRQHNLNELFAGRHFHLHLRTARLMAMLMVMFVFCSGIPLLVPIFAFDVIVKYWLEKRLILRYYRRPEFDSEEFAMMMWHVLPVALCLHLGFAVWMLGENEVIASDLVDITLLIGGNSTMIPAVNTTYPGVEISQGTADFLDGVKSFDGVGLFSRILRQVAVPHVILFLIVFVVTLVWHTSRRLLRACVRKCILGCTLGRKDIGFTEKRRKHFVPAYSEVFERERGPKDPEELPDKDTRRGWVITTDPEGKKWLQKEWLEDGSEDKVQHYRRQKMRTWEVIRERSLFSYRMDRNPTMAHLTDGKV